MNSPNKYQSGKYWNRNGNFRTGNGNFRTEK